MTSIREYYLKEYPDDDMGPDINPEATFEGLYQTLKEKGNPYEYIGVLDSLVREGCFAGLAEYKNVDYDVIYDLWYLL